MRQFLAHIRFSWCFSKLIENRRRRSYFAALNCPWDNWENPIFCMKSYFKWIQWDTLHDHTKFHETKVTAKFSATAQAKKTRMWDVRKEPSCDWDLCCLLPSFRLIQAFYHLPFPHNAFTAKPPYSSTMKDESEEMNHRETFILNNKRFSGQW